MTLRYDALVFDLDATLVDSYAALREAVNHALRTHGEPEISDLQLRGFVGDGMQRLLERAFDRRDIPGDAIALFESRYDEVCCTQSRLLDEVDTTLEALERHGVTMGVCTNKPTRFSTRILDQLAVARHFRVVAGPDLCGAKKPDGAHVEFVMRELAVSPARTLMVGDMPIDVNAARNAGIDVAVIATGSSSPQQLADARADYYLERFGDLEGIVVNGR